MNGLFSKVPLTVVLGSSRHLRVPRMPREQGPIHSPSAADAASALRRGCAPHFPSPGARSDVCLQLIYARDPS